MKEGWKMVKLGEVVKPSENYVTVSPTDSYKLLGMSLEGRGLFVREEKLGSEVSAKYLNKVVPGEFMYSRLFAWKGAFDKVANEFEGCFVSDEYPAFQPNKDELDIDFLTCFFQQKKVWAEVEQFCIGVTKASRNRFKEKFFLEFEIPLPPLTEQQRIAGRLAALKGKIDAVRRLRGEQVREVREIEKRVLKHLFEDLRQEIGFEKLGNVAEIVSGGNLPPSSETQREIMLIKVSDLNLEGNEKFITKSNSYCSLETSQRPINSNAIVFPKRGGAIATNKKRILNQKAFLDPNLMGLYSKDEKELSLEYLFEWFCSFDLSEFQTGTSVPQINKKDLVNLQIPIPSVFEQRRIVAEIQAFQTKMEQLKAAQVGQLAGLEGLFPAVLERAFRGEW